MNRFLLLALLGTSTTVAHAQLAVTAVVPAPNARAASRTSPLTVSFNQPLTAASASALRLFSAQRGGLRTRGATPAEVTGSDLRFTPTDYYYRPGETVQYTVTRAAAGSTALPTPRVGQFTTAVGGPGTGTFSYTFGAIAGQGSVFDAQLADVDNDGDLDVLGVLSYNNAPGSVGVCLNDGVGGYTLTQQVAVGTSSFSLAVGDVDSDGDIDFVVTNGQYNSISVRLNTGSGRFVAGQDLGISGFPQGCAFGDVDGDGDLDLVLANGHDQVPVLFNNGAGYFSIGPPALVGGNSHHVALGDVDSDGDLDLVTALDNLNAVSVCLNNGTGSFTSTGTVPVGTSPYKLVLGDIDGDGDLDFMTANSVAPGSVSVGYNSGNGIFTTGANIAVGNYPQSLALGDVDADGDLDLLAANQSSASVTVRLNNGAGTFSGTRPDVAINPSPRSIALGDVDGDGDLDFITAHSLGASTAAVIAVGLNGGTAPAPAPTLTSFTPVSGPVGTSVTLTGTNLLGAQTVKFNGVTAPGFTVNAPGTQLTVAVPAGATTGRISVTTPGGTATSASSFTVLPSAPVVSLFYPATGVAGTTVTLSGSNFVGVTGVTFNGVAASSFAAVSTASLTAVVPAGATTGPVGVTAAGGTGTSNASLQVLQPAPGPIVLNGYREARYGAALTLQTTPTSFGNATGGGQNTAAGSELDAAYAYVHGDSVYVFLAGNLESNGNTLEVFFDSRAGGQNVLSNANPNVDNNGLNKLAGLTFDADFSADYYLTLKTLPSSSSLFSVAFASLGTGGTGSSPASTGTGRVLSLALPGNLRGTLAVDQSNTGGVDAATVPAGAPAAVVTGVEFVLPLAALAASPGTLKMAAFLNGPAHDYLSNQVLGGLPFGTASLMLPSTVNFASYAGRQYFEVPVALAATSPARALRVQLYPNPGQGRFTLELPAGGAAARVQVFNALGQVVSNQTVAGDKAELNLTGQAAGVYLVRVQAGAASLVQQLVISQ